jgi:transposase
MRQKGSDASATAPTRGGDPKSEAELFELKSRTEDDPSWTLVRRKKEIEKLRLELVGISNRDHGGGRWQ